MLRLLAIYGLQGLQRGQCFFEKNTAKLRCMARRAGRHLMHIVSKGIARINTVDYR